MSVHALVAKLRELDVRLWVDAGKLRFRAPSGVMTDVLRAEIAGHKPELLLWLERASQANADTGGEIGRVSRDAALPLSFAQQRLWVVEQISPGDVAYNMPLAIRLSGELDRAALDRALTEVVKRHETLHTRFVNDGHEPRQVIDETITVGLGDFDLSSLSDEQRSAKLARIARDGLLGAFELSTGPLLRAVLVRLTMHEHVLLLTMHHIVSDGWSLGVLMHELGTLYGAFARGEASPLAPLPVQYADFAVWQRSWLHGDALAAHVGYWKQRLARLATLELATDHPRPPVRSNIGAVEEMLLPASLMQQIQVLSRGKGVTPFMTLLATFFVLLQRYSAQDDLTVGSPIGNRARVELEGLIGLFVNMLVLRADLSGEPTFHELLEQVKETCLSAYEHQDVPFETLVDELDAERDPSRNPLFQVAFMMHEVQHGAVEHAGVCFEQASREITTSRFDLEVSVYDSGAGLGLAFVYATDLFAAQTVRRMVRHYAKLLEAVVAAPDRPVSELSLLDDAQRQQLLVRWNETATDYPREASIAGLFEEQVARSPGAVALVYGEESLTYRQLDERANQLAHHLRDLGVGAEVLVGLCVERSLEMVVGVLGILKAGGAYVPLDAQYPQQRLAFMLEDTGAPVLLVQSWLEERLPAYAGHVVRLDTDWSSLTSAQPRTRVAAKVDGSSLAYVMYTSGSTGVPKGVCVEQRSVVRLVRETNYLEFGAQEVFLQFAPMSFDAATLELWGALLNGSKLVVYPAGAASLEGLGEEIRRHGVTVLWLTGALFRQMVDRDLESLSGVRQLLAGGEALSVPHVRRVLSNLSAGQRLVNGYGPTENTTFTCCHVMESGAEVGTSVPIGRPISNTQVYVLDAQMEPVPMGVAGELYIGGDGLARGYWQREELTAEKFVANPFAVEQGQRLYRSGDLVRYRGDGTLEFLGRIDQQVKLRGYRIELGEVEAALGEYPQVREAVVLCREDVPGDKRLVAYVVPASGAAVNADQLRTFMRECLPEYMVPSTFVMLDELPVTPNGKVDRAALPVPTGERQLESHYVAPRSEREALIADIWCEVLGVEQVGVRDNFFDLGGNSLLLLQVRTRLMESLGIQVRAVELFQYPSVEGFASYLAAKHDTSPPVREDAEVRVERRLSSGNTAVAVVGLAGRFPGAPDVDTFWSNLRDGVESIRFFSDEELRAEGVDEALLAHSAFVPARGALDDVELFDASFFGYTPREAELMDPQQRIFLECAWTALENAGCDPARHRGAIGVYAGASKCSYRADGGNSSGGDSALSMLLASGNDFLTTRVSYKLNLRGPSMNVQTACSTSLVAVHEACRALGGHECDLALAGGVSVYAPRVGGYVYQELGIASPDGHCRAFDADAQGTVAGEGVGVVVLKRLDDALADGDCIRAVILGTAINNDGADKVGFTAPSVEGQAGAIALAQAVAGVESCDIDYVETHGTGTALGDPIEVAALTRAFGSRAPGQRSCALGALKTNVGHLDAAAGVAGLIKTVLAIEHAELPPTLHFNAPNPEIDFDSGQFHVNAQLTPWPQVDGAPRRAGVSSFGIGGTNAHVVLEQAPVRQLTEPARDCQVLLLSAKSAAALETSAEQLAEQLAGGLDASPSLADIAWTLQTGRSCFEHRLAVVARTAQQAADSLRDRPGAMIRGRCARAERKASFMFPGQGTQHLGMGADLYRDEAVFRDTVDVCAETLAPLLELDLRDLLYTQDTSDESARAALDETRLTQPALFVVEYALAQLWQSWGVLPAAMIGHSIGEYVAACLAGVLSLEDALRVVAERGRLMQTLDGGAMLAVPMAEAELAAKLENGLAIASVNAPSLCVVSGEYAAIDALERQLISEGLGVRRLRTSHAFHSPMMEPVLARFETFMRGVALAAPRLPYISNVTGTWISDAQATDAVYYARHMRAPVRFCDGVGALLARDSGPLLEVGPGRVLCGLASSHSARPQAADVIASLGAAATDVHDGQSVQEALARLWVAGVDPDWSGVHAPHRRARVVLPGYPFERQRFWVHDGGVVEHKAVANDHKLADLAAWFHTPSWHRLPGRSVALCPLARSVIDKPGEPHDEWLLVGDDSSIVDALVARLRDSGQRVSVVRCAQRYSVTGDDAYTIDLTAPADWNALFDALAHGSHVPKHIVYAAGLVRGQEMSSGELVERCFVGPMLLAQALARRLPNATSGITLLTSNLHDVTGNEVICPQKATTLGPCRVIPIEFANMSCRSVDVTMDDDGALFGDDLVADLFDELVGRRTELVVALRGGHRWIPAFEPLPLEAPADAHPMLRDEGVYLITGGLGGIGYSIASALVDSHAARLVLLGRTTLPAPDERDAWLASHSDNDPIVRAITRLRALEAQGAEVLTVSADVADADQLAAACVQITERFGRIDGVIHAAGIASGGVIQLRSVADAEAVLAPKVTGTLLLAEWLDQLPAPLRPDFMFLCSSLTALVGAPGQVDYTAANAFLDAFSQRRRRDPRVVPTICVNWDAWSELGMAVEVDVPDEIARARDMRLASGMSMQQGQEVFRRILASGLAQVVVSTRPIEALHAESARASTVDEDVAEVTMGAAHPRPQLDTEYAAPVGDLEIRIARIWEEMFGIQGIGRDDDFFALGGHSLLAIQLFARVGSETGGALALDDFFTAPTIAGSAAAIAQKRAGSGDNDRVEAALELVDQLSDEEVLKMLGGAGEDLRA